MAVPWLVEVDATRTLQRHPVTVIRTVTRVVSRDRPRYVGPSPGEVTVRGTVSRVSAWPPRPVLPARMAGQVCVIEFRGVKGLR